MNRELELILWAVGGFVGGVIFIMLCTAGAIEELYRRRMREVQGKSGTFRVIVKMSSKECRHK